MTTKKKKIQNRMEVTLRKKNRKKFSFTANQLRKRSRPQTDALKLQALFVDIYLIN